MREKYASILLKVVQVKHSHWIVATLLALLLIPALHAARLPLRFAWTHYIVAFYWALGFQSMVLGIILFSFGYPRDLWCAIAGKSGPKVNPIPAFTSVFLPATYMFFVLVLTFGYNDVIAAFRFDGLTVPVLNRMDSWLMGGWTVADFSRRVSSTQIKWLGAIYFGMFPQVGACLFILALREGRARAFQFIGALATAYFMGLACFYFLPATGPYYLSTIHPDGGYVSAAELQFTEMLNALKDRQSHAGIDIDYFVAFPCLHIAQPLIVLWFLRKSKGIVAFLLVYDLILIPAIILLQQHYVVDLIGGACVAVLAIAIMES